MNSYTIASIGFKTTEINLDSDSFVTRFSLSKDYFTPDIFKFTSFNILCLEIASKSSQSVLILSLPSDSFIFSTTPPLKIILVPPDIFITVSLYFLTLISRSKMILSSLCLRASSSLRLRAKASASYFLRKSSCCCLILRSFSYCCRCQSSNCLRFSSSVRSCTLTRFFLSEEYSAVNSVSNKPLPKSHSTLRLSPVKSF